jgi:hypothetical protein
MAQGSSVRQYIGAGVFLSSFFHLILVCFLAVNTQSKKQQKGFVGLALNVQLAGG